MPLPFSKVPSMYFLALEMTLCKTCVKLPLSKRQKIGFQDQLSLNACQKYYRMLQGERSAIPSTFIKLPFVINIFVLFTFECPFHTGFTVLYQHYTENIQTHILIIQCYLVRSCLLHIESCELVRVLACVRSIC